MFDRGHLDHLALGARRHRRRSTTTRERLVGRGATDGAIEDLGAFHSVWFTDPDGMRVELVVIVDEQAARHPRPATAGAGLSARRRRARRSGRAEDRRGPSAMPRARIHSLLSVSATRSSS